VKRLDSEKTVDKFDYENKIKFFCINKARLIVIFNLRRNKYLQNAPFMSAIFVYPSIRIIRI